MVEKYSLLKAISRDVFFIVQQGNRNMEEPSAVRLVNVTLSAFESQLPTSFTSHYLQPAHNAIWLELVGSKSEPFSTAIHRSSTGIHLILISMINN